MSSPQPGVDLLLARSFLAAIALPAFLLDGDGVLTFYNEAAGELIGRHFEESGRLTREEWTAIGPVDESGRPIAGASTPLTIAVREGKPACGRFRILTDRAQVIEVETSATPLIAAGEYHGAMVVFVPLDGRTA